MVSRTEGHVSGEHQYGIVVGERLPALHYGVSGSKLLALLDEAHVIAGNRFTNAIRFVPDDA